MRKIHYFTIVCVLSLFVRHFSAAETEAPSKRPCELPEGMKFDFWVGEWELSWPAGQGDATPGHPGKGTNSVKKILGDCIVQENFENSTTGYKGMSVSAFQPKRGEWQQTWVDTEGSYLLFSGGFKDGAMELLSPPRKAPDGTTVYSRMRYKNITRDSFDWDYQFTKDDGKTWVDNWNIHYARKK